MHFSILSKFNLLFFIILFVTPPSTLLSKLLLDPVQKYASEVTEFGVFGYKKDVGNKKSSVNLDSILLADELIKLKTLRDDAVITTEEFNELKKKLLDR